MDTFSYDVRYALRTFRNAPGFTAIAALSIGLAIGAATAVFGFVDALLLRPLRVPRPGDLVTLEQVDRTGSRFYNLSLGDRDRFEAALAGAASSPAFTGIGAVTWADGYDAAAPEAGVRISLVSGNYFSVLDVAPRAGRLLSVADDQDAGSPVAVISDRVWQRRYDRAPNAIGRALVLNGHAYTIAGVAPAGFSGDWVGWPTDVWIPSTMASQVMGVSGGSELRRRLQYKLIARLRPGVTRAQADAAAQIPYRDMQTHAAAMSGVADGARLQLVSAASGYSRQRDTFVRPLAMLMVVVAIVLLIACANTANLLLARAAFRQREIAVRLALGAGRGRIVRLLLTESALLAIAGASLGFVVAAWGSDALNAIIRSAPVVSVTYGIPTVDLDVAPDARVLLFTIALSVLTSLLVGIAPAFRGARTPLVTSLTARGFGRQRTAGPRAGLLILQIAASLVLVVGAGLFGRTLHNLRSQDLGFERDRVSLVWAQPAQTGREGAEIAALWRAAQDRLAAIPGVVSTSASVEGVLTGTSTSGPRLQAASSSPPVRVQMTMTIAPRYFETMRQPIVDGREFTWQDTASAPPVAVVNVSLARLLFGAVSVAGRQVGFAGSELPPLTIVGVVADARALSPRAAVPALYYPAGQNVRRLSRGMCLVVRSDRPIADLAPSLRAAVRSLAPDLPIVRIDSATDQLDSALFEERLLTGLSISLSALAVVMTGIGLYALVAFTTARRTNELGIRVALGATPGRVTRMVVRETAALALAGIVLGVPMTLPFARWISSRLFGVEPLDPLTIAAAIGGLLMVVAMAAWVPARRAAGVDPIAALRSE